MQEKLKLPWRHFGIEARKEDVRGAIKNIQKEVVNTIFLENL